MRKLLLALALCCLPGFALAQSSPGFYPGQVPTAAQWNSYFAAKQDYVPGSLTGPGASTYGDMVCWGSTYPATYDCGAVPTVAAGTGVTVSSSGHAYTVSVNPYVVPRGYIDGLNMSTAGGSATFAVAAGQATDGTAALIEALAASISKTTSSWAQGTGNGCLDTGSIAGSTWYYIWLIEKTDKSAVDVLCSTSNSSPTMPSGWSYKRYIGALYTNGAVWNRFIQVGNEFRWYTPVASFSGAVTTTVSSVGILVPNVPVLARVRGYMNSTATASGIVISSPQLGTPVAGSPAGEYTAYSQAATSNVAFTVDVVTSNQAVSVVSNQAATNVTVNVDTYGWTDFRGANN